MAEDLFGEIMNKLEKTSFFETLDKIIPGGKLTEIDDSNRRLYFTPLNMDGLEEMFNYSKDERLYEYFEFPPQKTIDETKAYIEKLFSRMGEDPHDRNAMYWFVRRIKDNKLVGTFCFVNIDYNRSSAEWGYGVDPELWGNAYPLEIMKIAKNFAFNTLGLNRIWGQTMVENVKTVSSLKAAGCKEEGILRDFYCKNGKFHDAWAYSILKSDFENERKSTSTTPMTVDSAKVAQIVSSVIGEEIKLYDQDMDEIASWDSITHFEVVVELQNQLGYSFSPEEITELRSINRIVEIANSK